MGWTCCTPVVRPMTDAEFDAFGLIRDHTGKAMEPAFEGNTVIWVTAVNKHTPTYRLYDCGTNNLRIFRYDPDPDRWLEIEWTQIDNVYGLLWLMSIHIAGLENKLKKFGGVDVSV